MQYDGDEVEQGYILSGDRFITLEALQGLVRQVIRKQMSIPQSRDEAVEMDFLALAATVGTKVEKELDLDEGALSSDGFSLVTNLVYDDLDARCNQTLTAFYRSGPTGDRDKAFSIKSALADKTSEYLHAILGNSNRLKAMLEAGITGRREVVLHIVDTVDPNLKQYYWVLAYVSAYLRHLTLQKHRSLLRAAEACGIVDFIPPGDSPGE